MNDMGDEPLSEGDREMTGQGREILRIPGE